MIRIVPAGFIEKSQALKFSSANDGTFPRVDVAAERFRQELIGIHD
jgi:hypothetical protein